MQGQILRMISSLGISSNQRPLPPVRHHGGFPLPLLYLALLGTKEGRGPNRGPKGWGDNEAPLSPDLHRAKGQVKT